VSGSYLVCDLCGKFGPPSAFLFEENLRLCYECFGHSREQREREVRQEYGVRENSEEALQKSAKKPT
jgi:hypothetical protein